MTHRTEVWRKLATKWKLTALESMVEEVGLDGLEEKIQSMLKGGLKRRILVSLI
jgi:ABC-type nitrate/sulfonate/bicarbonate transport system ATPase subunit